MKPPKCLRGNWLKLVFFVLTFIGSGELVFAATVESQGIGGYGWQQIWWGSGYNYERLTGSSDRQYYDYGYKDIQIFARHEDYWSQDCGWWYVSSPQIDNIKLYDNGSGLLYTWTSPTVTNATAYATYIWGSNTSGTEKPETWTVNVTSGTGTASFKILVRGQLDVTSITNSSSPTAGSPVTVNATIVDQRTGTAITSGLSPVLYVTGGAGYAYSGTMSYSGGYWNDQFTPNSPGDYKLIVKATDGHNNWIDGRGSTDIITVTGSFPSSFGSYVGPPAQIAKIILMILLALLLLRSGRKAAMAAVLIFMGGIK